MSSSEIFEHFYKIPTLKLPLERFSFEPFEVSKLGIDKLYTADLPDTILGKQAEYLFESLLKQSSAHTILASNIQIQGKTTTLGELDYIVKKNASTKQIIHIEFACKFYLLDANNSTNPEAQWIGPNRKDTLYDKLQKLKQKQFPLIEQSETIEKLHGLSISVENIVQQYCVKTSLFIPHNVEFSSLSKYYQNAIVGKWIRFSELALQSDCLYAIVEKQSWLQPISAIKITRTATDIHTPISEAIKKQQSVLLYEKCNTTVNKLFVVWW